jgi:hypothetical protein
MTKSHALAFALVVSAHVVALAAWDQHLTRHYAGAFTARSEKLGQAPTVTVVATRRAAPEGDFPKSHAP